MSEETVMNEAGSGTAGGRWTMDASGRPLEMRLLSMFHRVLHGVSGGRLGSLERGRQTPTGWTLQLITAVHRRVYRWTGGAVGSSFVGLPNLLLTTTGRKTGLPRTVPLPYLQHPEGVMVVASFAGNPNNPAWYENLAANPDVEVQIGPRRFRARATTASADERAALWPRIVVEAQMYADYQKLTTRVIPVVILREVSA
jgi:deazaflavin-dependent oxidoreductase (nitroreductase family)